MSDAEARPADVTSGGRITRLRLIRDGPLQVKGEVELQDEDGAPIDLKGRKTLILCRCGNSRSKPFCDGSHLRVRRSTHPAAQADPARLNPTRKGLTAMCAPLTYTVTGMTCSSCADKVLGAVETLPGIAEVDVDLATATLTIVGHEVADADVRAAVTGVGYQIA